MIRWISASKPPGEDMFCFVVCRRRDGTLFMPGYRVIYTTGIRKMLDEPVYTGFMQDNVVAWMPIPEPYSHNKRGWILTSDRYPEKKDAYIVSTYSHEGKENVAQAVFDPDKLIFYSQHDAIAWMPIPKWKER